MLEPRAEWWSELEKTKTRYRLRKVIQAGNLVRTEAKLLEHEKQHQKVLFVLQRVVRDGWLGTVEVNEAQKCVLPDILQVGQAQVGRVVDGKDLKINIEIVKQR
jgi:hypothetical protein